MRYRLNDIKKYCILLLFAFGSFGCDNDDKSKVTLRSDSDEFYDKNNTLATNRLSSIMYNKSNVDFPTERFKIVHISDAHVSNWSSDNKTSNPANLIESVKFANQGHLKINAMVATGDHISDDYKYLATFSMESFFEHLYAGNAVPTFPCYGNHDKNMKEAFSNEYFSTAELNKLFDNKNNYPLQRVANNNYYYADVANPMGGVIRFISLDMLDQPGNDINSLFDVVYSKEQMNWLGNVALKEGMTPDHHVIILNHFPFQPTWGRFLQHEKYIHYWKMVPEIVEAFRSKQTIDHSYNSVLQALQVDKGPLSTPIHIDFDFTDSPGDFICYMGGHAHITAQFSIKGLSNQSDKFPEQKMLLCTNMSPSDKNTIFNKVERNSSSLENNSFCIYAIDTWERNIYITFFGAYLPKGVSTADYPEVQVIPY